MLNYSVSGFVLRFGHFRERCFDFFENLYATFGKVSFKIGTVWVVESSDQFGGRGFALSRCTLWVGSLIRRMCRGSVLRYDRLRLRGHGRYTESAFSLLARSHAHATLPSAPEVNRVGSVLRSHPRLGRVHTFRFPPPRGTTNTQPVEPARAISFMPALRATTRTMLR